MQQMVWRALVLLVPCLAMKMHVLDPSGNRSLSESHTEFGETALAKLEHNDNSAATVAQRRNYRRSKLVPDLKEKKDYSKQATAYCATFDLITLLMSSLHTHDSEGSVDTKELGISLGKIAITYGAHFAGLMVAGGKYAPFFGPTAMLACGLIDMFLPQPPPPPSAEQLIAEAKKEIMAETRSLIRASVLEQSLREVHIEISNFVSGTVVSSAMDSMEPDAALAYALALENDVGGLAERLLLPCTSLSWGSSSCQNRVHAGAATLLSSITTVHFSIFEGIFQALNEKLQKVKDYVAASTTSSTRTGASASVVHDVDQVLTDTFQRVGCPNSNPPSALATFKTLRYESRILDKMKDMCKSAAGSQDAQECCGDGEGQCTRSCKDVDYLHFALYDNIRLKRRNIVTKLAPLFFPARDMFMAQRLRMVTCGGNECVDGLDQSSRDRAQGNIYKRELWEQGLEMFEIGTTVLGEKEFWAADCSSKWQKATFALTRSKGHARIFALVKNEVPYLRYLGYARRRWQRSSLYQPSSASERRRMHHRNFGGDVAPVMWDLSLTNLKSEGLYLYFQTPTKPDLKAFSLMAQAEKFEPLLEWNAKEFAFGSKCAKKANNYYYRCPNIKDESKSLISIGSSSASGERPLHFSRWDVQFYMRLHKKEGTACSIAFVTEDGKKSHFLLDAGGNKLHQEGKLFEKKTLDASPYQIQTWHSYRVSRRERKLWVFMDDELLWEHDVANDVIIPRIQIRPWRNIVDLWGVRVTQGPRIITVLGIQHRDQPKEPGKYFSFDLDDIVLVYGKDLKVWGQHCRYTQGDASWTRKHSGAWFKIFVDQGCEYGVGSACGRRDSAYRKNQFKVGDKILLSHMDSDLRCWDLPKP
ncbi:unnamed protein product [Symbiodinium natans]|uniref:Uncharacterized protein n=1 Tax=Symbiodinium natans TaxID=878477 RepID=A0A812JH47_9DINO|nr:unnamed protein product [Symbiodinium natans]